MEPMYQYLDAVLNRSVGFTPKKILDIGAWNGYWTLNCKNIWPDAHYTCIEAGQKHSKNLELVADEHYIEVLGDTNKTTTMYLNHRIKPNGKVKPIYSKGANIFGGYEHSEQREMKTLGSVVGADARYDFIKQDVQGAEIKIIQGSIDIFQRATYILNEVNIDKVNKMLPSFDEMNAYMSNIGFTKHEIVAEHPEPNRQYDVLYYK